MKFLLLPFLLILPFLGFSQSPKKVKLIQEMIVVQGTIESMEVAMTNMVELQKRQNPSIDEEFWNRMMIEFKKDDYKDYIDTLIPIYDKHYSEEQIQDIINFFSSETGKHLVERQPSVVQESMDAGAAWGEKIGMKIAEQMMAEENE